MIRQRKRPNAKEAKTLKVMTEEKMDRLFLRLEFLVDQNPNDDPAARDAGDVAWLDASTTLTLLQPEPASRRAVENLNPPCLSSAASRRPGPSTRRTPLGSSSADPNGQPLAYVYWNGGRPVRDDARQ